VRVEGLVFAGLGLADPSAAARFLTHALGAELESDGDVHRLLFPNGSSIALVPAEWVEGPSDTLLGFLVDDLDEAADELAANGAEADGDVLTGYGFRYRHFRAPDGRRFELLERGQAG
jgi:catechol 2,3-dioxygenase-like lactoylglutathione lyase family enzyme